MLLLLNEHGDYSFLFQNLSSYDISNQLAVFEKNLSVGSISVEWLKITNEEAKKQKKKTDNKNKGHSRLINRLTDH